MKMLVRLASAAFAASMILVSMSAMAEDNAPAKKRRDGSQLRLESFPMKADQFQKLNDARLSHMQRRIDHAMKDGALTAEKRAEATKVVDSAMKQVKAGVTRVSADGVVTQDESKEVGKLMKAARKQIHQALPSSLHRKGNGKRACNAKKS